MLYNQYTKMDWYFPKPYKPFGGDISVKMGLSNYGAKTDLEKARRVDISNLAAKSYLASLKAEVDKIDVGKLKTVPVDFFMLKNVVHNEVVKRTVYDKLVVKVNTINTSGFVSKTEHNMDKSGLEKKSDADKKIPDTSALFKRNRL